VANEESDHKRTSDHSQWSFGNFFTGLIGLAAAIFAYLAVASAEHWVPWQLHPVPYLSQNFDYPAPSARTWRHEEDTLTNFLESNYGRTVRLTIYFYGTLYSREKFTNVDYLGITLLGKQTIDSPQVIKSISMDSACSPKAAGNESCESLALALLPGPGSYLGYDDAVARTAWIDGYYSVGRVHGQSGATFIQMEPVPRPKQG
jgi:hypothetical protein